MWPKAFAQFVELAPHISRLLPMADRFFQAKNTGDDANRIALEANRKALDAHRETLASTTEDLRTDLVQVTAAHTALQEQLLAMSAAFGDVVTATNASRSAAESLERRLSTIEARQNRMLLYFGITLFLLIAMCILLILLYVRGR